MVKNTKDFLFGLLVFIACSLTGGYGIYGVYTGLTWLYDKLCVVFTNGIAQFSLMFFPILLGIICCGVYVYLLGIGSIIFWSCCYDN